MFVDEMPERVQKLTDLFEAADWEGLRRTAHQIKGAAGSYGFLEISPLAATLENSVRAGQGEDEILQALESLHEMCMAAQAGSPE
jgi:HPt (histidine-containing phosphotransfer) domain-containing protein